MLIKSRENILQMDILTVKLEEIVHACWYLPKYSFLVDIIIEIFLFLEPT